MSKKKKIIIWVIVIIILAGLVWFFWPKDFSSWAENKKVYCKCFGIKRVIWDDFNQTTEFCLGYTYNCRAVDHYDNTIHDCICDKGGCTCN